jgi:hypothetical protein
MAPRGGPGAKTETKDAPKSVITSNTSTEAAARALAARKAAEAAAKKAADEKKKQEEAARKKKEKEEKAKAKAAKETEDAAKKAKEDAAAAAKKEADDKIKADAETKAQGFKDAANFASIFKGLTGIDPVTNPWANSLYAVGKKFVDSGQISWQDPNLYNLILNDTTSPELQGFRDRFSAYLTVRNERAAAGQTVGEGFGNIAEYTRLEGEYQKALNSRPAFKGLATQDNIKKFITGTTSVQEVQDRIDNAYFAVTTADEALKEQIRQQFPTLTDDDLALTLVTGNTDAVEQKIKFGAAAIGASAKLAGLAPASDIVQLSRQGVTREGALKGFQQVARERTGIQQASRMFGQEAPTQAELEAEALGTGAESASAKRLRSQARAQFGGQTGIVSGSLGRKRQV